MVHKTDWKLKDTVKPEDLNRIEENNSELESPTFDDTGIVSDINSFTDFINSVKSRMNIFEFFKNFKAGLKYIVHQGQIINSQDVTQAGFALDARQANPNISGTLGAKIYDLNKNITNNLLYKYITSPDTVFDIAQKAKKSERYFAVQGYLPSDLPEQAEFFIDVMVDQATARKNIIAWNYPSFRMYKRQMFNGKWLTDWKSNITNSDINVQKNTQKILLTTTKANVEISEPNNTYYIIRNDYCFVSLSGIKMTSIEGGNIFYNLPKPVGRVNFTLHAAGGDSKPIIWGRIDETAIFFNNINSSLIGAHGWGSFCYPIAK